MDVFKDVVFNFMTLDTTRQYEAGSIKMFISKDDFNNSIRTGPLEDQFYKILTGNIMEKPTVPKVLLMCSFNLDNIGETVLWMDRPLPDKVIAGRGGFKNITDKDYKDVHKLIGLSVVTLLLKGNFQSGIQGNFLKLLCRAAFKQNECPYEMKDDILFPVCIFLGKTLQGFDNKPVAAIYKNRSGTMTAGHKPLKMLMTVADTTEYKNPVTTTKEYVMAKYVIMTLLERFDNLGPWWEFIPGNSKRPSRIMQSAKKLVLTIITSGDHNKVPDLDRFLKTNSSLFFMGGFDGKSLEDQRKMLKEWRGSADGISILEACKSFYFRVSNPLFTSPCPEAYMDETENETFMLSELPLLDDMALAVSPPEVEEDLRA